MTWYTVGLLSETGNTKEIPNMMLVAGADDDCFRTNVIIYVKGIWEEFNSG